MIRKKELDCKYYIVGILSLCFSSNCLGLGSTDELVAMIKSHNNQDNIVQFITDHRAIINNYVSGYTPLMHAIFENLGDVAQRLIEFGADIHLKDQNNLATALMYATSYGLLDTVTLLVKQGARLTDTDRSGRTVWDYLQRAKNMNKPSTEDIRLFLEQHAAVPAQGKK